MTAACSVRVRGAVQGVGFRPFVFRLAQAHALAGWVSNHEDGVEIHVQGPDGRLQTFLAALREQGPPAAEIDAIEVKPDAPGDVHGFAIRDSPKEGSPSTRIVPDLAVCDACLADLFDPADRRYRYPYINCTNCGPRYTVIEGLPYDRPRTTMREWPLDAPCEAEYRDPADRRFHAQPVACPACGPDYALVTADTAPEVAFAAIEGAARLLAHGSVVAVKGLGGYHLACDAENAAAVRALRTRKFRKEKPFAVMARDLATARRVAHLTPADEVLMTASARPIVLVRMREATAGRGVSPDSDTVGIMLPYAPLHFLLFHAGAPDVLVMTSANRSSEPIAYEDADALERLTGLADAFLVGARRIARRVDDSVVRAGACGPVILRRARGYAPDSVATVPAERPILAVGGDLKNAIALVVRGQVFVAQHIGDLAQSGCARAFHETIADLASMYDVSWDEVVVAHDAHPEYASTQAALGLPAYSRVAVPHHRAHVASVLAEHGEWDRRVVGVACDGTGYGDDGTIWGGELFVGSVRGGFERAAHLAQAALPGGDAAAEYPVQAAAGFLRQLERVPDVTASPFCFPPRYGHAQQLLDRGIRTYPTTSMGRLFDAAAALLGFTREVTFEGQAAMWLEQLACRSHSRDRYPFPLRGAELDFRPILQAVIDDRRGGRRASAIARAFHLGIADGLVAAATSLCAAHDVDTVVLSGGVFQNELLLQGLRDGLSDAGVQLWTNHRVPPNDGGLSLGQAALAAFHDAMET